MGKRSLKSSQEGIIRAKQAFESKGWTQDYLASEVELSSRQSIWKFFTARPIERQIFQKICQKLELDWTEIADLPQELQMVQQKSDIEDNVGLQGWVSAIRQQLLEPTITQCNTLQSSFELNQPLLSQIYTSLNILPQPSYQRWLEVSDFRDASDTSRFNIMPDESLGVEGLEIVEQHDKLMILGKPGAGKTTFLQYLALQCIQGKYHSHLIPLLIPLRNLHLENSEDIEFSLGTYLSETLQEFSASQKQAEILLHEGKLLLLLDGLDEVLGKNHEILVKEIDKFSQLFYKNQVIITCRSAAKNYYFKGFTYVEIDNFNDAQIQTFAQKWFLATATNEEEGRQKAKDFQEQLNHWQNQPIRELGITPILLNLICSVFKERSTFPTKRAKLYQTALDILLQRWDQARGIQRDQVYRSLSLPEKIKLLCKIAAATFELGNYVFEIDQVLYLIEDYLRHLPDAETHDLETLWLNCEAILKAIELQHGLLVERAKDIYSFSHITFQEYLTARKIVATDPDKLSQELSKLSNHVVDKRWREVILLTISMLPQADSLLQQLHQAIKHLESSDQTLNHYLQQIATKVNQMKMLSYRPSAVRAFYFTLFQNRDLDLATSLDPQFAQMNQLPLELKLDAILARALTDSLNLQQNPNYNNFLSLCFTLELEDKFRLINPFKKELEKLKKALPDPASEEKILVTWWERQGEQWIAQFRQLLLKERQIGYLSPLTPQQEQLWQQYYTANLFLLECLGSDGQVSNDLQENIKDTLLLP